MERFATSALLIAAASHTSSAAIPSSTQFAFVATIPEPVSILLLSLVLLGFSALARRRLNREP
ncbi:MAG TPA: PEP-CTERM sorting domain-containing protein [Bryobacteraceae bacterium]|jgi:hypothetical protein|nr:PEP-CTERM sorting domain-containing protein [Bryobacteraceae bacterium]